MQVAQFGFITSQFCPSHRLHKSGLNMKMPTSAGLNPHAETAWYIFLSFVPLCGISVIGVLAVPVVMHEI